MVALVCLTTRGPPESPCTEEHDTCHHLNWPLLPQHSGCPKYTDLARILPSLFDPGTDHVLRQVCMGTLTLIVSHHLHHHFLKDVVHLVCLETYSDITDGTVSQTDRQTDVFALTVAIQSPSRDPAVGSVMESAVPRRQADWRDFICEVDRSRQLEEADVVVYCQEVVPGVDLGPCNGARLFALV